MNFKIRFARQWVFVAASMAVVIAPPRTLAAGSRDGAHLWKPVADEPYLQEVGEQIATAKPVTSVAVYNHEAYLVVGGVTKVLREGALQDAAGAPKDVQRLRSLGGAVWAAAADGTYRFTGAAWERVSDQRFVDFCLHLGVVHATTRDELFRFDGGRFVSLKPADGYLSSDTTLVMEDFSQVLADPVQIGAVDHPIWCPVAFLGRRAERSTGKHAGGMRIHHPELFRRDDVLP